MTSISQFQKIVITFLCVFCATQLTNAQAERELWKLQFAVGVNKPFDNVTTDNYFTNSINFVTINLGLQHMFKPELGAKLDLSFNRSQDDVASDEFKLNYTRINAQVVYDGSNLLTFLPPRMNIIAHAGPGLSFTKPLGPFANNKQTFLNAMAGLEFHYGISQGFSVFTDVSYILGFGKDKYDTSVDGFAFNGNLMTITVGVSVALSGCQYCDD